MHACDHIRLLVQMFASGSFYFSALEEGQDDGMAMRHSRASLEVIAIGLSALSRCDTLQAMCLI
jgi:hypothetical protein